MCCAYCVNEWCIFSIVLGQVCAHHRDVRKEHQIFPHNTAIDVEMLLYSLGTKRTGGCFSIIVWPNAPPLLSHPRKGGKGEGMKLKKDKRIKGHDPDICLRLAAL